MAVILKTSQLVRLQRNSGSFFVKVLQRKLASDSSKLPVLTLYTKDECQLCDEAKQVLTPLSHRYTLEEVDITLLENKEWRKYRFDIPVFHFNGKYLMKHRVNLEEFEKILTQYEEANKEG